MCKLNKGFNSSFFVYLIVGENQLTCELSRPDITGQPLQSTSPLAISSQEYFGRYNMSMLTQRVYVNLKLTGTTVRMVGQLSGRALLRS